MKGGVQIRPANAVQYSGSVEAFYAWTVLTDPSRREYFKSTASTRQAFKVSLPKPSKSLDESAFKKIRFHFAFTILHMQIEIAVQNDAFKGTDNGCLGPQHESSQIFDKSDALKAAKMSLQLANGQTSIPRERVNRLTHTTLLVADAHHLKQQSH
jgi:hypothetical protein